VETLVAGSQNGCKHGLGFLALKVFSFLKLIHGDARDVVIIPDPDVFQRPRRTEAVYELGP
jgi:hypothetical protein